jgi:hypothetical protein
MMDATLRPTALMTSPIRTLAPIFNSPKAANDPSASDRRRNETLERIRAALLDERLAVLELSGETTGTDPYNSGVHRTLGRGDVWSKRSR